MRIKGMKYYDVANKIEDLIKYHGNYDPNDIFKSRNRISGSIQ